MYLFILTSLRKLGLKKSAVRLAYFLFERNECVGGYKNLNRMFDIQTYLFSCDTGFPDCAVCVRPILSDTEKLHAPCREEIQRREEEDAEVDAFYAELASMCTLGYCWESREDDSKYCTGHSHLGIQDQTCFDYVDPEDVHEH